MKTLNASDNKKSKLIPIVKQLECNLWNIEFFFGTIWVPWGALNKFAHCQNNLKAKCEVPENIHTPPTEGFFVLPHVVLTIIGVLISETDSRPVSFFRLSMYHHKPSRLVAHRAELSM